MTIKNSQLDILHECALSNVGIVAAARRAGISVQTARKYSKKLGITFQVFPGRRLSHEPSERDKQILSRFDAGETLESIAQSAGLTRERVRQIAARWDRRPRRAVTDEQNAALAERFRASGSSRKTFAKAESIPYHMTIRLARRYGVVPPRNPRRFDTAEYHEAARDVANGRSIRKAATERGLIPEYLRKLCKELGIPVLNGRWRDFSHRRAIIEAMARTASFDTIARAVSAVEQRPITSGAIYAWALRHAPDAVKRERQPSADCNKQAANIILAPTEKEVARLNYGRASASQIAAAIGTSRNVIIGHWYRLRSKGLIA